MCSGGTPKSTVEEYYGGDIPWLNTKEVNFNRIYSTESTISESGLNNSSAKWIDAHSVIVAMYGATAAKCAIGMIPMTTNQACCNLMIDEAIADYRFVYYALTNAYSTLASLANGGAQQNLNAQLIKDFEILLPDLQTQHRIADILSTIDDKIENNNRINHNLEEQAQALYKSWFVDFEPFKDGKFVDSELGMIPEGWVVRRLGDVCKCVLGGTPSRNNSEYWGGSIAWINSGAVNEFRIIEASEYITEKGLNSSATKLLPNNTVVLAITGATLGQFSILAIPSCANQSVIGILQNGKFPTEYIYPLIANRIDDLMLSATGGAQQHINKNNVEELYVLEPTDDVMSHYLSLTRPLYEQINAQYLESNKLSCTRDYLLPRLMDGFISV